MQFIVYCLKRALREFAHFGALLCMLSAQHLNTLELYYTTIIFSSHTISQLFFRNDEHFFSLTCYNFSTTPIMMACAYLIFQILLASSKRKSMCAAEGSSIK